MRKPRPEIWLLIGSVAVTLLVAEFTISRLFPQRTYTRLLKDSPRIFAPSETMPYTLLPNSAGTYVTREFQVPITINSLGYRDDEFPKVKTVGMRILAIGDSFTFGTAVPGADTYPNAVESCLRSRLGTDDVEVINAGFAACNYPDTYYLYLKDRGLELDPDIITVGLFVGNDLDHDAVQENAWTEVGEDGLPLKIQSTVTRVEDGYWVSKQWSRRYRVPIVRDSHLVHALMTALRTAGVGPERPRTFNQWIYRRNYEKRTVDAVLKVERLLSATASLAREKGIPILFVIIPAREQVYPEEYDFSKDAFMADYDLDKPQRILTEYFESQGMAYLDLLPIMRQQPRENTLYYPRDQHWNTRGNMVAGRAIAEFLIGHGWVMGRDVAP